MESDRKQIDVKNKTLSRTWNVSDDKVIIHSNRLAFPIDKADYQNLTKTSSSIPTTVVASCLGVFIAYMFELTAKIYEAVRSQTKLEFESWKIWVLVVSLGIAILGFVVVYYLPTERNKLLKKIRRYLDSEERVIEARREIKSGRGDTNAI